MINIEIDSKTYMLDNVRAELAGLLRPIRTIELGDLYETYARTVYVRTNKDAVLSFSTFQVYEGWTDEKIQNCLNNGSWVFLGKMTGYKI